MKKLMPYIVLMVLIACSPMKVLNTEQGDNIDFTKYKTYNFFELKASGDTLTTAFAERSAILKNAIIMEMNKRGYSQSKHPDLLINIGIVIKEMSQIRQTDYRTDAPFYLGQRNYSWKSQDIIIGTYRDGAVSIDIVDATQNKMVWKGSIEAILANKNTSLQRQAKAGMKLLFKNYPVAAK